MQTDPSQDQLDKLVKLYHSGKMIRAVHTCKELLKTYKQSLILFNILGAALQATGKFKEAINSYNQVIKIHPDDPDIHYNLGFAFHNLGQFDNAIISYNKAIQLKPDYVEAYNNLGMAFQAISESNKAIENYTKAIQIKPDYAESFNNLGIIFQEIDRPTEAVENYNQAIQINPNYAKAYRHLSILKRYQPNDPQIKLMQNMLRDSSFSKSDHTHLYFALAKAYEDLDEFEKSFNYLKKGNHLRKEELNYDINYDKKLSSKIKDIFSVKNLDIDIQDTDDTSIQPIFIVGMPRSGTSLVEQIIASHTKVYGAGELETITQLVKPIISNSTLNNKDKLSKNNINLIRSNYLKTLDELNVSENIVTDKMPRNFQWIGFIMSAFPNAKIIHLNRNPIAVCWSIYKHYFSGNGNGYAYNMNDLMEFYELYADLMSFWNRRFPDNIYNLCYEDLVENQKSETHDLLKFCDLEWDEQCLDFHKTKRIVKTASSSQVRKKIYKGSSEAWKKYEKYLQPLIQNLKH